MGIRIQLAPSYSAYDSGDVRPYCLNYTNSSGELASTRFTYDKKGLNDRGFYQQILGGRSSRNVQTFDKQGRVTGKFREYNDGETSTETFEYGPDGSLIAESFVSSSGASGKASYIYNAAGQAFRVDCVGYKGWLHATLEFSFLDDGRRKEGIIHQADGSRGRIRYQYDSRGNLTLEQWEIGDWSQTLQFVYESAD